MSDLEEKTEQKGAITSEKKMTNGQKVKLALTLILVGLLVTFIVQNLHQVEVQFLTMTNRVSLVMVILVSALIGGLLTFLLLKYRQNKNKK